MSSIGPVALTTLALGLVALPADAQDVARRAMRVRFEEGVARVDANTRDLADAALRRRLESGLPQTIVTRVYAYRSLDSVPVALAVRSCRVTHDPWSLTFRVQVQTDASDRTETMSRLEQVLAACFDLVSMRVGRPQDWAVARGQSVWIAVLVELNPLSPDTVHRIRRWLARPDGAARESDSFFGSFVSLFVNRRLGGAERTFQYRSAQEVRCP